MASHGSTAATRSRARWPTCGAGAILTSRSSSRATSLPWRGTGSVSECRTPAGGASSSTATRRSTAAAARAIWAACLRNPSPGTATLNRSPSRCRRSRSSYSAHRRDRPPRSRLVGRGALEPLVALLQRGDQGFHGGTHFLRRLPRCGLHRLHLGAQLVPFLLEVAQLIL